MILNITENNTLDLVYINLLKSWYPIIDTLLKEKNSLSKGDYIASSLFNYQLRLSLTNDFDKNFVNILLYPVSNLDLLKVDGNLIFNFQSSNADDLIDWFKFKLKVKEGNTFDLLTTYINYVEKNVWIKPNFFKTSLLTIDQLTKENINKITVEQRHLILSITLDFILHRVLISSWNNFQKTQINKILKAYNYPYKINIKPKSKFEQKTTTLLPPTTTNLRIKKITKQTKLTNQK